VEFFIPCSIPLHCNKIYVYINKKILKKHDNITYKNIMLPDCSELLSTGVTTLGGTTLRSTWIQPNSTTPTALVQCALSGTYGLNMGHTLVLLNEVGTQYLSCAGSPFNQSWVNFKNGFTTGCGRSLWLGNELLHKMTSFRNYSLQVRNEHCLKISSITF